MTITILPKNFNWFDYQAKTACNFFSGKYKRFIQVNHRRAGKDHTWKTIAIGAALQKPQLILYTLPTIAQAKKVIWRDINEQGQSLDNYLPDLYIDKKDNSDLYIKFINGSLIQFAGADNFDSLRGTNPNLIIFSEASYQSPKAWDIMSPILAKNGGTAVFLFTPYGKNHAYHLYQHNINNENWYTELLTVDDTFDHEGKRLISDEAIEEMRQGGMSEALIQQEFYCSFTASIQGAYFAYELDIAEKENRIINFALDRNFVVDTYWDLGNTTAVWLFQKKIDGHYAIYYYEDYNLSIRQHWNNLCDIRDKLGIVFGNHYGPHDVVRADYFEHKGVMEQAEQQLGISFVRVPRISKKQDGIEAARTMFNKIYFHKDNTDYGRECLLHYHSEYNEKNGIWAERPAETWANHGTDAFMQFAQQNLLESPLVNGYNRNYRPRV